MVQIPKKIIHCSHYIGGKWVTSAQKQKILNVISPYTGTTIGQIGLANQNELDRTVHLAKSAQRKWAAVPLKERCELLLKAREVFLKRLPEITNSICSESGKIYSEAEAEVRKGIEVLEYAISLENILTGGKLEVSRGVTCEMRREPVGVVAGITPFNFPAMVPMWMIPISIALGNSFIWKPSDKTPLTSRYLAEVFEEAGLPAGVFSVLHGNKETVNEICAHRDIQSIGFVGSTAVAKMVYEKASAAGKKVLSLGGAKNHIILMPDANPEVAIPGILASFTGCAGQRCMAASVLLIVGSAEKWIQLLAKAAKKMVLSKDMGAIITEESLQRLHKAIEKAKKQKAKVILDGRTAKVPKNFENGFWLGPTILDKVTPKMEAACEELFGPILSIVRCKNLSEAMTIANKNRYGNACSVFTNNGAVAEEVARSTSAGMVGVNIGVPVPREPFSFGGTKESKFGSGDITGEGSLNLWSNLKKITVKWQLQKDQTWMS